MSDDVSNENNETVKPLTLKEYQKQETEKILKENPDIKSRELAKKLTNRKGKSGISLQVAQGYLREYRNVPLNINKYNNPYGRKGKGHHRYRYYLEVVSEVMYYPLYEPVTNVITYGFNNQRELDVILHRLYAEYPVLIARNEMNYTAFDGAGHELILDEIKA